MKYSERDLIKMWLDHVKQTKATNSDIDVKKFLIAAGYDEKTISGVFSSSKHVLDLEKTKGELDIATDKLSGEMAKIAPYYNKLSNSGKRALGNLLKLEIEK